MRDKLAAAAQASKPDTNLFDALAGLLVLAMHERRRSC